MSAGLITEFTKCLGEMSYCRAGWDYQLPKDQRAEEDRRCADALKRAREIWADNPAMHDALTDAFNDAQPLATMAEIKGE